MKQRFELDQEVEVRVMGKITNISSDDKHGAYYTITYCFNETPFKKPDMAFVHEDSLNELPKAENFKGM